MVFRNLKILGETLSKKQKMNKLSKMIRIAAVSALFILCASTAHAWSGKCVNVIDGDTIKVMHLGTIERIRLYGIDCPEKKQAFFGAAKQFTADLVLEKTVEVEATGIGRYGRTIAWVYAGGKCLNRGLLKAGLARHFKRYSKDPDLAQLEILAKQKKIGIWQINFN